MLLDRHSSGHRTPWGIVSFSGFLQRVLGTPGQWCHGRECLLLEQKREKLQIDNCAKANDQAQMDEVLDLGSFLFLCFFGNTLTPR